MKVKSLLLSMGALAMVVASATAQTGYSINTVGYANVAFQANDNWFGNPLDYAPNTLSAIFYGPTTPVGTTISLWDSSLDQFTTTSTWDGSSWSANLTLAPGTGALLEAPSPFTNTFVGTVLDFNGSLYDGNTAHQPPPFSGPGGMYLLSSKTPVVLTGHVFTSPQGPFSVFESIIGRAPQNGEQVTTLDPVTQLYHTSTFMNGSWNNGDPTLQIGEAAMFNLLPVPEPSVVGLLGVGLAGFAMRRRARASS
jgi:hypothetical protein